MNELVITFASWLWCFDSYFFGRSRTYLP